MHEFRYIELNDIARLATIINRAYRPVAGEEGWTHESQWITDDRISPQQLSEEANKTGQHIVVATLNQVLVGCVMFSRNQRSVTIGLLTVDPDYQQQQLGQKLMSQAEHLASELYDPYCFEMSVVNTRTELIAFYERRGYKKIKETKPYPKDQGVGTPKVPVHLIYMQKINK